MKKLIILLLILTAKLSYAGNIADDCSLNGIKLNGKVKIVNAFADFEVKKVNAFEDLRVKVVNALPSSCGEWQFVDAFEDFSIKFVDAFEDFSIKEVEAFPGIN